MISIVTLTFNNFDELVETIQSLKPATGIESVVVNGGTDQKTLEFLQSYPGRSVSEKDQGIADGFSKGTRLAQGDAIAFLNSGDLLLEADYYSRADEYLKKHPEIDFIYSDLWFQDPVAGKIKLKSVTQGPFNFGRGMPFLHPTMVVRKRIFEKIGDFKIPYRIAMDFEWAIRLVHSGAKGHYLKGAPVLMDGEGVSTTAEARAFVECQRALEEHQLFSGSTKWAFHFREFKFLIRTRFKFLKVLKGKLS